MTNEPRFDRQTSREVPEIVLVSTSPYRRALMERFGLPFRCRAPLFDEETRKDSGLNPESLAQTLAREKVESVRHLEPDSILIGADQVMASKGTIHGKPGTVEAAIEQLMKFSGREHDLITSVMIRHRNLYWEHTDITTVRFRRFGSDEAERYVNADLPLDCAGSYKLESKGFLLVDRIFSNDESAIVGLPLLAIAGALRVLGFQLP